VYQNNDTSSFLYSGKDVLKGRQGQGTDYETPRSVLKVREEWRMISNAEIGGLL